MTGPTLQSRYSDLVKSLITLLELRNPYNIDHCKLVARYCVMVADRVGLDERSHRRVELAAEVHTLGVALQMEEKRPNQNLPITRLGLSSGREAPTHVREGSILRSVLGGVAELDDCIDVVLQRYEWFDGSQSVLGLAGEQILSEARLLAVVDAFIDLATPKKHRPPVSTAEVLGRIRAQSGSQFDPVYVDALVQVVTEEEGRWQEAGRVEHFETARCRHYLRLGHLYTAIHEWNWALRSYLAAEKIAVEMQNRGLELGAISGQVMVHCDRGELEMAREALQRARTRSQSERERHGYHLMWGLVEWLDGRHDNGQKILDRVAERYHSQRNVPGLAAAMALQANMLLIHRGTGDPDHLNALRRWMGLVRDHDLFDVVERYRSFTLPLFLSALTNRVETVTARANLTKMGEPCQEALLDRLKSTEPSRWMKVLMPEPVIPEPGSTPSGTSLEDTDVRVVSLGAFRVQTAQATLVEDDWPTQKSLRMFAHLAVERGTPLSDEYLMETFWPDSTRDKARNSLRNAIHQIRSVLRRVVEAPVAQVVVRSRKAGTTSLNLDYSLDTDLFEQGLRQAAEQLEGGEVEQAMESTREALALYQGDFLEGIYEDWAEGRRVHCRESYLRGLQLLGRCYLAQDNPEAAEVALRKLLAKDDLREDAHCLLIEALNRDGRPAEAVSHYEQAVELFETEIGVAPAALRGTLERQGLLL